MIYALLIAVLMAGNSGNLLCSESSRIADGECRPILNKTDFYPGESIIIEFIWKQWRDCKSGIVSDILIGKASLEFSKNQTAVYKIQLSPISAPRRKSDNFSISYFIPLKSENFTFPEGEYRVKAVSDRWKTGEAFFRVHK